MDEDELETLLDETEFQLPAIIEEYEDTLTDHLNEFEGQPGDRVIALNAAESFRILGAARYLSEGMAETYYDAAHASTALYLRAGAQRQSFDLRGDQCRLDRAAQKNPEPQSVGLQSR